MSTAFMQSVDQRSASARASGDLLPIDAEQTEIFDQGLPFIVRWVSSLSAKDAAKVAMPGGPRDPNFNPFLKPDPELVVGLVGDHHVAILNKFPVSDRHLVLARREFEEQLLPLALHDFAALAQIMSASGGLGFYNGGTEAGASQRHKHVQWIPTAPGNASLQFLVQGLPADTLEHGLVRHPGMSFPHAFVKTCGPVGHDQQTLALSMHQAFGLACDNLGLVPDASGLLSPCNMLVENGWLLVVPRRCEHVGDISVNALSYGGTLYVRHPEQVEPVRQLGPLNVLAQAAGKSLHTFETHGH